MNYNKIVICGRLGRDPELKALPNGTSVCDFSLATSRTWVDGNTKEKHEETEWHNVVFYGKPADIIAQYVKKGSILLVEGRVKTRSWEDKDSGKKMYRTEIIGENFQLPPRSMSGGGEPSAEEEANRQYEGEDAPPKKSNARHHVAKTRAKVGAPEFPEEEVNPEDIPF